MSDTQKISRELLPYLPGTILKWYEDNPSGNVHLASELEGVLICIDASGFTSLTRDLSERGRSGPETLTSILNSFFEEMAGVVFQYDGDILKFAGDALWAYFPHSFNPGQFIKSALDALERSNESDDLTKERPLSIHVGAEFGTFSLSSLGEADQRLEAEPMGQLVDQVYTICDEAGTNELYIGPNLASKFSDEKNIRSISGGLFLVDSTNVVNKVESSEESQSLSDRKLSQHLEKYLPADVLSRLKSTENTSRLQSEHRLVVALFGFFRFTPTGIEETSPIQIERLNQILNKAFGFVREFGGSVARIDPYQDGHKLLILFGAPKKHEQDEIHAVSCARKLLELTDDEFHIRIGIALGPLFCGDVGASTRREYTIMGDAANMAARLMSKSQWGRALIDSNLKDKLPEQVQTKRVELALKGIGDNVSCYQLGEIQELTGESSEDLVCVGQKSELKQLNKLWAGVQHDKKEVLLITGEAGVGKSLLISQFMRGIPSELTTIINCDNSVLFGRGWLIRKTLLTLDPESTNERELLEWCDGYIEARWRPLLGEMLEIEIDDNDWTKGLSPELRLAKICELFVHLVSVSIVNPHLFVVDDFDKCDNFSRTLFIALAESANKIPVFLALISRNSDVIKEGSGKKIPELAVANPEEKLWWEYFKNHFETGKREKEFFDRLLKTSRCNPLWVMDFVAHCVESGQLRENQISGRLELHISEGEIEFPQNFVDIHLSRFDRLRESDREVLKVAAMVGETFTFDMLKKTLATIGRSIERKEIAALANLEIIQRHDQKNTFEFRRSSMREAIYSCIPEEELRRLHKTYAEILGASKSDIPPESLAYHYFKARMFSESFSCSLESAKLASRANSLTEASRNLQRCMEILTLIDDKKIKSEQLFNFYREMASSLGLEGRYKEVYPLYRRWRRLGKRLDNQEEVLYSVLETAKMLWRQTKYGRCRRVLSSVLGSKEIELDSSAFATACSTMADLQRRSGDFTSAREWCEKAIAIGSSSGDSKVLANSHNKLGLTLWGAGELELAASEFETSLKYGKENNGQYSRGRTINNLGIINFSLGHFIKAEKMLAEALQIFGDIGDTRNEAYASGNLANINRYIGRITRAKELFGRSDLIFERLNDSHAHFYTVGNLGDIELMLGNLVRAEENFKQSAEFAESVGDKELAAECGVRFGELSFFCGDMTTAEKRYGEAIELAKSIGSKEWVIRASIGMARLCIFQRKSEEAQRLISEIKELASAENAVIACNEAIYLSGEQFRISGDLESATKQYREVLGYARSESLFELTLKSAVRLYESDQFAREEAINILNETARQFIEQNSHDVWNQVLMSAYFSFFSSTLEKVLSDYHPASPKML